MDKCLGGPVVNTENYRKLTENYGNQLKIFQETINNDLQNVRLYKNVLAW